jgi:hypothetical protein
VCVCVCVCVCKRGLRSSKLGGLKAIRLLQEKKRLQKKVDATPERSCSLETAGGSRAKNLYVSVPQKPAEG